MHTTTQAQDDGKKLMRLRWSLLLCLTVVFWFGVCRIKIKTETRNTTSCHHVNHTLKGRDRITNKYLNVSVFH